jgi:hypothetical protein
VYNKEVLELLPGSLHKHLLTSTCSHAAAAAAYFKPAGSDGLWDNVYNKEILELLPSSAEGLDAAADKIARLARRHAADENFASPYTNEAKAQG